MYMAENSVVGGSGLWHKVANVVGSIGILGLGVFGFVFFGAAPPVATVDTAAGRADAPIVSVSPVNRWNEPFQIQVNGEATSWRVVTVGAEVAGRVLGKSSTCRSGLSVMAGDVLFQLDAAVYEADEQRLSAKLVQAKAELHSVEVEQANVAALLKLAEEDQALQREHLLRVRSLFERKATSETELDNAARLELTARNAVQMQRNQLASLGQSLAVRQAAVKLAETELQRAELDLARCTVRAPISGRVVEDVHEEGDYIRPGDTLVRLSDGSHMDIRCSLRTEELGWIWRYGQQRNSPPQTSEETASVPGTPLEMPQVPCEVVYEVDGIETSWEARLERMEGTGMDRSTRTFPCRVVVDQPLAGRIKSGTPGGLSTPPALLSGMFVSVRVPITAPVALFRIPAESLRPGERLWLARDGQLKIIAVSVVQQLPDGLLVHQLDEPLLDGDSVITSPLALIQDGMSIQVQGGQQ